ncbi:PA14 domain-containing protein [Agriterribacter sp.]|uniref:PA14 domain-containing protein n=1 Tax=Agriterribacter sp. TaxID=2821509 RepID=UPI002D13F81A|nr:PA14 domain-containing protein [Agriterribacter sp.]HTN08211.1 PA14 domain-containing protein [Agriterribacter sp.]
MIHLFLSRHRKGAAATLLLVFFLQFCCTLYSSAWGNTFIQSSYPYALGSHTSPSPILARTIVANAAAHYPVAMPGNITRTAPPEKESSAIQKREEKNKFSGPGPGQPEMQSFQSVNSNNLVDLFSGDFSYSIPLADVGGYAVNIHYRSGITMDQEASWVGLGWNINPGAIGRNMRGLPDDFNGEDVVTKTSSLRPNWTAGGNVALGLELFGLELNNFNIGLNGSLFYNNYKGIGISAGASVGYQSSVGSKGSLTAGIGLQSNSQSGVSIAPSFAMEFRNRNAEVSGIQSNGFSASTSFSTRSGLQSLSIASTGRLKYKNDTRNNELSPSGALYTASRNLVNISFAHQAYTPSVNIPFTSYQFSFNLKPGGEVFGTHPNISFGGFFSRQYIAEDDKKQEFPAFGYMYYQKARDISNALLDYNREKELTYHATPPVPHIAIPNYTYDVYSITGEGTGGMFRPYRGDIGFVRDAAIRSKSVDGSISLDLGAGNLVHAGYDVHVNAAVTGNGAWAEANLLSAQLPFKDTDSTFEAVYFKNPAEKTINPQSYYDKLGDTDPVLPVMSTNDDPTLSPFLQPYKNLLPYGNKIKVDSLHTLKRFRDKRSQVISYLTAADAALFGLDKSIFIYPVNSFFAGKCDGDICNDPNQVNCKTIMAESRVTSFRKKHHLSEITVLNADGRRYVYGLPVYNTMQKAVSFSVDKADADIQTGLAEYSPGTDNTTHNTKGKDNFYGAEDIPPYAHSFLLTGIVSANYADKTGDGITDDDMGDAVKFNYCRPYGNSQLFHWRTPLAENKATYNEGLKTDYSDDKGSYIYGQKEIWYLHSLESKSMIATFTLNDPQQGELREDAFGLKGENGGTDMQQPLRYLKQIDVYSKADYIKNKEAAKPVKTVHFEYNDELCRGVPSAAPGKGKLTLKKIWFTYNKNNKGQKNPYVFLYHPQNVNESDSDPQTAYNPAYDPKGFDRWGNYKDARNNPAQISNADYPYTLQSGNETNNGKWDSAKAAIHAAAWTLSDIILPSGGRLNVQYESDDYAYVQNRRAMQMFTIAGFGSAASLGNMSSDLYGTAEKAFKDYRYVFIKLPSAVSATLPAAIRKEIFEKYLSGTTKLYFRLRVQMPADIYGSGNEQVTTYAQYEDYGLTADNSIIWIKIKGTDIISSGDGAASPLAKTALQVLKLNLPSKAYPGSDLNGNFDALAVVKATFAVMGNISELFLKFPVQARIRGWAKKVNTAQSFVRLNNPEYKKYGDGLRVKRITVYDNWNKMTGGAEQEATYGQEYDYTTVKDINGVKTIMSSGVASYEPVVGNEENPFREPIEYNEQIAPLAPVNNMYSEHPLGEAFFPSASVGYSKVRTRSIHYKDIKSANGYEESEFYTTYDFPTIVEHTPLEKRKYHSENLLQILNLYSKKALTFSQGFKIETNDMNGKLKGTASYPENDPGNPLAYTKYYYKVQDENAEIKRLSGTVAVADSANGHINMQAEMGKDIELMVDMREQEFKSQGAGMEFNIDGFVIGILPVTIPFPWLIPHFEMNRFRSAAVTKTVQRYGIVDKIMVYEKGSLITTENILYDGETGDVLLTKTQNEFNDPVYQFNYPAHWAYSGMGAAYSNIGAVFHNISFSNGKIITAPGYPGIEKYFESGDEIKVFNGLEKQLESNGINICTGFGICNQPVMIPAVAKKIWAVHAAKIQHHKGLTGMYFIDENGRFFTGTGNDLQILRSGRRNMAATGVGNILSLQNPVQQVAGKWKLVLDNTIGVTNSTAQSYKDLWKVEDARYQPLTITTKTSAVKKIVLNPVNSFSIYYNQKLSGRGCSFNGTEYRAYTNAPYFESLHRKRNPRGACAYLSREKSWLKFDLAAIPSGATIVSSGLALYPHYGLHEESDSRGFDWNYTTRDHNAATPHKLLDPNAGRLPSNAILHRVTNKSLFNDLDLNTLSDNSTKTKNIFNNRSLDELTKAVIPATKKQNSFIVDVKNMVAGMIREPAQDAYIQISPEAPEGLTTEPVRVCFWATNSYIQDYVNGCNAYAPGSSNTNASPSLQVQQNVEAIAPALVIPSCAGCSNVTNGYDAGAKLNISCPTAPQLTIEYIACGNGERLIQECDSFYCGKTVATDTCISQITDTATNPYRWGILGNWRMDKAYNYYENRTEADIPANNGATNIRTDGTINQFNPYWIFRANGITAGSDTVRWVWNTQSTQFNRRGFETENKDPLGRYNAVQYGYHESMPVAITQNSTYAEHAFDGFEDYEYNNNKCDVPCAIQKHIPAGALQRYIVNEEAHSGKFSLGIPVGSDAKIMIPLGDTLRTGVSYGLQFNSDTTTRSTINRVNNGAGLKATVYSNYNYWNDNYGLDAYNYSAGTAAPVTKDRVNINYDRRSTTRNQLGLTRNQHFYKVVWEGYMTLRKGNSAENTDPEGLYRFSVAADNSFKLWINDKLVLNAFPNDPVYFSNARNASLYSDPVQLYHGKYYKIRVEHADGEGEGLAVLNWKKPNAANPEIIPASNFHNSVSTAEAAIVKNTIRCISWEGTRTSNHIIYDEFAPIAGNTYLLSAWAKEEADCRCDNYANASIELYYTDQYGNYFSQRDILKPSGNIIEGWQRIEEAITIPAGAKKMEIYLKAAGDGSNRGKIFFDDWRFLPYNGNMRSLVYDAVSLRLMSELDENNYATFYEYDDDGSVIRVKKETERGIKTIKETRTGWGL